MRGQSIATFNFRTVTDKFNKLVYRYPIRIPERYALVIRSLLTQVTENGPLNDGQIPHFRGVRVPSCEYGVPSWRGKSADVAKRAS